MQIKFDPILEEYRESDGGGANYLEEVSTVSELPGNANKGDFRFVTDESKYYIYSGSEWVEFFSKNNITSAEVKKISAKQSLIFS